jgi:DNA-binding CsgD family transcriptional regulator
LLDRNPAAIVLFDENKHVIFANRAAQEFQAEGDGLRLSADGVTVPRKQDNDRLQSLIAEALVSPAGSAGGAMRALRPSGRRPYGILVGPVSRKSAVLSALRPAVCIVITDPDRAMPELQHHLQEAFGLTEAEARLAALLASGEKLQAAAARLRITYGTGRTRLAEIFQKTDTRSQAELVVLLMKTLAV